MSFDPDKWRHSAIVDSQFRNLFGQTYSAIAIYAGEVSILETEGAAVSFTRNIGMTGSPLFSSKAELTLKNVRMFYNYGQEGACLLVNNSRLQILNALFRSNKANHGGVIFAVA
jgi:predicted outer membrane repeat protein